MDDMDQPLKNVDDELKPRAQRERLTLGAGRRSREADDRDVIENRDLSDDDRLEMFRKTLFNDVLPDLPDIPGYHVCWLSTNHPNDTIARRQRLGYELIQAHEIPGFEYTTLKTGEYAGGVGVNEMVAFKLPQSLYQAFMQEAHHREPARQAEAIASQIDSYQAEAERDGGRIMEGDGMQDLRRSAPSRGIFRD